MNVGKSMKTFEMELEDIYEEIRENQERISDGTIVQNLKRSEMGQTCSWELNEVGK